MKRYLSCFFFLNFSDDFVSFDWLSGGCLLDGGSGDLWLDSDTIVVVGSDVNEAIDVVLVGSGRSRMGERIIVTSEVVSEIAGLLVVSSNCFLFNGLPSSLIVVADGQTFPLLGFLVADLLVAHVLTVRSDVKEFLDFFLDEWPFSWRNDIIVAEIACWFFIGECIGKGSIVGYQEQIF